MVKEPALRRDRDDAVVAGVCAALARSWGVDTKVVRVGFVIVTIITGGFAVAAYFALWALLPEVGSTTEPVRRLLPFTASWSTTALVSSVVVAALILGVFVTGDPGALVILLLAWLILRYGMSRRTPHGSAPQPPAPFQPTSAPRTDFERLAVAWQQRVDNVEAGRPADWVPPNTFTDPDPMGIYTPAPAAAPTHHPARRRMALRTWLGVAVACGSVWAGLGVLGLAGVVVPPLAFAAATLGVLAVTLVIVARPARAIYGRPPLLVFAACVAALVTGVLMIGRQVTFETPTPVTNVVTYAGDLIPDERQLGAGEHTVDLSDVTPTEDRSIRFTQDLGTLRIVVPVEGNVVVRYQVGAGETVAPDGSLNGLDLAGEWRRIDDPDAPTLTVTAELDFGRLEVVEP